MKAPPCEKCLGNPVDPHSGAKMQREADYNFWAAGGPSFERFYNSQGYYSRTSRDPVGGDFWRHSYAAEIVPIADINGIMAAARRPEGVTKFFRTDGRELHNVAGGGGTLQKLVDGGGATTGWRLTSADHDVELYDAQSRLASITRRSGHVHTLAYDAHRPTEVVAWNGQGISIVKPEHFFLERYRVAYANEMAHFFEPLASGTAPRPTIDDGVAALALAEAATTSWRERRIVEL